MDRTAVSGTANAGSIPVRSAKYEKPLPPAFGHVLGSLRAPAELRRGKELSHCIWQRRQVVHELN